MGMSMDKYFKDDVTRQIARSVLRLFHVRLSIPPEWSLLHASREAKQANRVLEPSAEGRHRQPAAQPQPHDN